MNTLDRHREALKILLDIKESKLAEEYCSRDFQFFQNDTCNGEEVS